MGVRARQVVQAVPEQPLSLFSHLRAVHARYAGQVQLEHDTRGPQPLILVLVHVHVPLGVCEDGEIAPGLYTVEDIVKPHRRVEVGGLDEQVPAIWAYRQQVAGSETFLKKIVEHVLGGKVKDDTAFVRLPQLLEPLPEARRGVVIGQQ